MVCGTEGYSQGIPGKLVDPNYDRLPKDLLYSEHYGSEVRMNTPRFHSSPNDDRGWVMIYVKVNAKGIWAEEFCRNSLGKLMDSLKNKDELIIFPLIPVSIASIYPNTFTTEELISVNNLVAILPSLLPSKTKWTVASANQWINNGPLKELLREWHVFFMANKKPSRSEILHFAQLLKERYKNVLKEVRGGQAPSSH